MNTHSEVSEVLDAIETVLDTAERLPAGTRTEHVAVCSLSLLKLMQSLPTHARSI